MKIITERPYTRVVQPLADVFPDVRNLLDKQVEYRFFGGRCRFVELVADAIEGDFFLAGGADVLGDEPKEVAQVVSFQGSGVDENTKDIGEWATESGVVILPLSSTVMSAEGSCSLSWSSNRMMVVTPSCCLALLVL